MAACAHRESLYALPAGGVVAASDPAYQKGVKFLLNTRTPDKNCGYARSGVNSEKLGNSQTDF
jgi:hypothetical protein